MSENEENPKIEKTSNIGEPELIRTASITREVQIDGIKTWVHLSDQFFVRDMIGKDTLHVVFDAVKEFCEEKGATTVTSHTTQEAKPIQPQPPQAKQAQADVRPDLPWRDTSNPNIKRLNERDTPDDVLAEAQSKKTWGLWYSPPSEGYESGAVFKDLSKLGKQSSQSPKKGRW